MACYFPPLYDTVLDIEIRLDMYLASREPHRSSFYQRGNEVQVVRFQPFIIAVKIDDISSKRQKGGWPAGMESPGTESDVLVVVEWRCNAGGEYIVSDHG
jgi:hypothetical protein